MQLGLSFWLGVGAGAGVMALHAGLRMWTHRLALRRSASRSFLVVEIGGLLARMAAVFVAVGLVLLYVPVHKVAFTGTVLTILVGSMVVEVRSVLRHLDRGTFRE